MTRVALALLLAASVAVAAPVPKAKKADPYPTAVGTKWEYIHDGDEKAVCVEEITKAEEKDGAIRIRVDVVLPGGRTTHEVFDVKDGEVWCRVSQGVALDPPILTWKGGAKEGDSWVNEYGAGRAKVKATLTVGKAEEITTAAGKYTATPVTTVSVVGKEESKYTAWYVDGVGLIRHTYDDEKTHSQELKAFTPGGNKK